MPHDAISATSSGSSARQHPDDQQDRVGAGRAGVESTCTGSRTKSFQSTGSAHRASRERSDRRRPGEELGLGQDGHRTCATALVGRCASADRIEVGLQIAFGRRPPFDLRDERHPVGAASAAAEVARRPVPSGGDRPTCLAASSSSSTAFRRDGDDPFEERHRSDSRSRSLTSGRAPRPRHRAAITSRACSTPSRIVGRASGGDERGAGVEQRRSRAIGPGSPVERRAQRLRVLVRRSRRAARRADSRRGRRRRVQNAIDRRPRPRRRWPCSRPAHVSSSAPPAPWTTIARSTPSSRARRRRARRAPDARRRRAETTAAPGSSEGPGC